MNKKIEINQRQKDILVKLKKGLTQPQIARELNITLAVVKSDTSRLIKLKYIEPRRDYRPYYRGVVAEEINVDDKTVNEALKMVLSDEQKKLLNENKNKTRSELCKILKINKLALNFLLDKESRKLLKVES